MATSGVSADPDIENFKKLWIEKFNSFSAIMEALSLAKFSFVTFASEPTHESIENAIRNHQILLEHQRALFITHKVQDFNKSGPVSLHELTFTAAGLSSPRSLSILLFSETSQNVHLLLTSRDFAGFQQQCRFAALSDSASGLAKQLLRDFPEVLLSFTSIVISDLNYNFFFYATVALCCSHDEDKFIVIDDAPWWYPHVCRIVAYLRYLSSNIEEGVATAFDLLFRLYPNTDTNIYTFIEIVVSAFADGTSQSLLSDALRRCVLPYVPPLPPPQTDSQTPVPLLHLPLTLDDPNSLRRALADFLPHLVLHTFASKSAFQMEVDECIRWEALNDSSVPQLRLAVLFWHNLLRHCAHQLGEQFGDDQLLLLAERREVEYLLWTHRRPVRVPRLFDVALAVSRRAIRVYLDGLPPGKKRMSFVELVEGLEGVPDVVKRSIKDPL